MTGASLHDTDAMRERFAFLQTEVDRLADLLDGVMQDDEQAIRDAAAWLATNRPEQETA